MSSQQDGTIAFGIEKIEGTVLSVGMDPLRPVLITSTDPAAVIDDIARETGTCESQGGYVDDIKFSTASLANGEPRVTYTALVMCRIPRDEETGP